MQLKRRHINFRPSILHQLFINTFLVQIVTFIVGVISMVVDGAVVSSFLGSDAISAYQYVMPVVTIYAAIGGFLSMGISTLCGKGAGNADINRTHKIVSTGVICAIVLALVMGTITITCSHYIAYALGARNNILALAERYLFGFGFSAPALMLTVILLPILQIDGDRPLIFIATISMTITNITISLLSGMVLFPGDVTSKMLSVSFATTLSYYISFILLLLHFFRKNRMIKISWRLFDKTLIKEFVIYGLPYMAQQISVAIFTVCFNYILTPYEGIVGSYGIINTASNICLAIGCGIGESVSVLSSVYVGEEDKGSLEKLLKISIVYSVVLNAVLGVFVIIFAGSIIQLFKGNAVYTEEQIRLATLGLRSLAISTIFFSINTCFLSYFQAMRRTLLSSTFSVIENFGAPIVVALIFINTLGVNAVFWSFLGDEIITFTYLLIVSIIHKKSIKIRFVDLMCFPVNFANDTIAVFSKSIYLPEEVIPLRDQIIEFCEKHHASKKDSFWIGLSAEEVANNVITYNAKTTKKQTKRYKTTINVRVIKKSHNWIIRFQDNGKLFNPLKYVTKKKDNEISGFGIRLLMSNAKKIEYLSTLNLNNLVIKH